MAIRLLPPFFHKMASTKLDICNRALGLLNVNPITEDSLTNGTGKAAQKCNLHFDSTKEEVLRAHKWNRAMKDLTLEQDSQVPLTKFAYRYRLPADYIRVWELNQFDPGIEYAKYWEIRGDDSGIWLHTDESVCTIGYVFNQEIGRLDSLCVMGMTYLLASKLAFPVLAKASREKQLLEIYVSYISQMAASADALEMAAKPESTTYQSRWVRSRRVSTNG